MFATVGSVAAGRLLTSCGFIVASANANAADGPVRLRLDL
jgi:hypothetical protein